jgi:hypothetical protein
LTKAETDLLFVQGQEIIQKHRNSTSWYSYWRVIL